MIGNTDFALGALHNAELLGDEDRRLHAGRLRLRFLRRRERALRDGRSAAVDSSACAIACIADTACRRRRIRRSFALFNAKKDSIYALYRDPIGKLLPAGRRRRNAQVLRRFLQDDQRSAIAKGEIMDECLGKWK